LIAKRYSFLPAQVGYAFAVSSLHVFTAEIGCRRVYRFSDLRFSYPMDSDTHISTNEVERRHCRATREEDRAAMIDQVAACISFADQILAVERFVRMVEPGWVHNHNVDSQKLTG